MKQKFYLISIIPNQQALLALQELRSRLFHEFGLVSAMAFEPVIPLAWFKAPVESRLYAGFSKGYVGGTSGETVDTVISGGRGHQTGVGHWGSLNRQDSVGHWRELGHQEGWSCSDCSNEPDSPPDSPDNADRPNVSESPGDHRLPEKKA